jgi:hypothetical protein
MPRASAGFIAHPAPSTQNQRGFKPILDPRTFPTPSEA